MAIDAKRRPGYVNSMLNDDLLAQILNKVDKKEDRKSFSEVCKQWLTVERLSRTSLRVPRPMFPFRVPMFPLDLLTKFPNLVDFRTTRELTRKRKRRNKQAWFYPPTDTRLEFIAKTCPKLETYMASFYETRHVQSDGHLGTKGLRALAIGCPKLSRLMFRGSKVVGNAGVDALCQSAHNLKSLHLADNRLISDHAFRAIGSSSISTLELTCCPNVTDVGLGFLANGSTSKTLRKLVLQYCRGITNTGIQHLVNLRSLEHLELDGLSPDVTDIGGVAISTIQTLRELKLSNICKLSDRTVVALAENCCNLEVLVLHRLGLGVIEPVPGDGIHAFSRHKCLKYLALYHLDESDVEIVLGCPSLESLVLDKSLIGTFGLMHGNSAGRVVKFESFDKPLLHFIPTVW